MANKFLNIFSKKVVAPDIPEPQISCVYSSGEQPIVDYSKKEDRSEKVNYDTVGRVKYGTGIPPSVYTSSIDAYNKFPVVRSCVTAISEAVAGLGIKVFAVKGSQEEEVQDHPFHALFSRPNMWQGSFEFMDAVSTSLDLTGNAFISKEKVAGGLELYLLDTTKMAVLPDPKLRVKGYQYYVNGQAVQYKPEEIIHIMYNSTADTYYGSGPLSSAETALKLESQRLAFADNFYKNGSQVSAVLETEQIMGESTLKRLRGEWNIIHQGVANAHKLAILQGGLKYKPIGSHVKDLDLAGMKKLTDEEIMGLFRVSPSVLGNLDQTGSSDGKNSVVTFWRSAIIPRLMRLESALNRGLADEMFGKGAFKFRFDLSSVVALQESKAELADFLQKMISTSVLTPNEGRSIIGKPRIEGPYNDQLLVSNSVYGNALIPNDQAASQGAGSNTPKPAATPTGATPTPAPKKPDTPPAKPKK